MQTPGRATSRTSRVGGRRLDEARRLRDLLRYEIRTFAPQELGLSDERGLTRRLGGSRNALREALQLLRNEHIVDRRPGFGTVVITNPDRAVEYEFQGLAREIFEGRSRVTYEVLFFREVAPIASVCRLFGQPLDAPLLLLSRLTSVDDRPVCIWDTYFRSSEGSRIAEHLGGQRSDTSVATRDFFDLVTGALETVISTLSMRVEAVLAGEPCSRILDVSIGSPLLRFERLIYASPGRVLALSFGHGRPDQIAIAVHEHRAQPLAQLPPPNCSWGAQPTIASPLRGAAK